MYKKVTIKSHIDSKIKVGDKVTIWDGSYLTSENHPKENFIIGHSYPNLLDSREALKNLVGVVIATGLTENMVTSAVLSEFIVVQDIQIKIGDVIFNTCSDCVSNINDEINEHRMFLTTL